MVLLLLLLAADCTGQSSVHQDGSGCEVTAVSDGDGLSLDLANCGDASLVSTVAGQGDWTVELVPLTPPVSGTVLLQPLLSSTTGGTFTELRLQGTVNLDGGWTGLWRQGFQSWSWSGVVSADSQLPAEALPTPAGDGDAGTVALEVAGTSWWGGLLGASDGKSVLMAAASAFTTRFYLTISGDQVAAVWGGRGEQISVAAGGSLALDPILVAAGSDAYALQRSWADTVSSVVGETLPPRELGPRPPTGWASWYSFYSQVTEDDVRRNLTVAQALNERDDLADLQVFQIDDGWEDRWGVWTAGDDFPSGMATLATEIQAAGMVPGLWMAPFYVHRDSDIYRAHDDWWVRGSDGEAIIFTNVGSGDYVIIDATQPEAGAWMAQQVADRVAEGWTYLKLDFLYAGAQEGSRAQDVTGVEAYHVGMGLLREAAGDAWLLACGAPFLPTVGYADQYRSGADIAFELSPDPQAGYIRWQARSTAARGFTNGRWWWLDPDQLLVREPLSDAEVDGAIVAQVVGGGAWLLGDDLESLTDQRLALALQPELVALRGATFVPDDPLAQQSGLDASPVVEAVNPDDQVPMIWTYSDGTTVFTALLNLSESVREVDSPGGRELLSGAEAEPGHVILQPGSGELWLWSLLGSVLAPSPD